MAIHAWRVSSGWNKAGHPLPCGRSPAAFLTCVFSSQHFSSYPASSRSDVPSLCPASITSRYGVWSMPGPQARASSSRRQHDVSLGTSAPSFGWGKWYAAMPLRPPESAPVVTHLVAQRTPPARDPRMSPVSVRSTPRPVLAGQCWIFRQVTDRTARLYLLTKRMNGTHQGTRNFHCSDCFLCGWYLASVSSMTAPSPDLSLARARQRQVAGSPSLGGCGWSPQDQCPAGHGGHATSGPEAFAPTAVIRTKVGTSSQRFGYGCGGIDPAMYITFSVSAAT